MFQTFDDVLTHLDSLGLFHMDFQLDRMRRAVHALHLDAPPCVTVQVVGTNGKGSTSTFLASLARAHGLSVGLYTSPHFVTPRERVRINGDMLPPQAWPALANAVYNAAPDLTYFEFLTVLGYLAFARAGVDVAVMEAGLGGCYDATTALPADLVCFVPIAMDHENVLGKTLAAIAADKSQALRENTPALTVPQQTEAMRVLQETAQAKRAELREVNTRAATEYTLGLRGPHQQINASLALAAWEQVAALRGVSTCPEAVAQGLGTARIAGRFQWTPPYVLDGAHNPHGMQALQAALAEAGTSPCAVIFSCLADKHVEAMLPLVRDLAGGAPVFTPTIQDNERAMLGPELAERLCDLGVAAQGYDRLAQALAAARVLWPEAQEQNAASCPAPRPIVVCGSLYLLGELFTLCPERLV